MTVQEKTYREIVTKVANNLQLPFEVVDRTYKSYWLFVRTSIAQLPLKEGLSEEDFNKLRTSINIPSLGKFSCDYERYLRVLKRLEYIKHLKDNDKTNKD